jgi:hypothetical protein
VGGVRGCRKALIRARLHDRGWPVEAVHSTMCSVPANAVGPQSVKRPAQVMA